MPEYLIIFSTKTIVNLDPENGIYQFDIGSSTIRLRKLIDSRDRIISPSANGLIIEVKVVANTIEDAIKDAFGKSEFFMSSLCYETSYDIHLSKIILAYNISKCVPKRQFRQYFYNLPISVENTKVPPQPFSTHSENIFKYSKKHNYRVFRAIRWFRKGINAEDSIDQFLFFWHGLESLNPPLANFYGKKNVIIKKIGKKCEKCGEGCQVQVLGGIEALISDLKLNGYSKKIKDIRNDISHGREKIEVLYESSSKILPIMAELLHRAISKILSFSFENSFYEDFEKISPFKPDDYIVIDVILKEKELSKIGLNNYYPFFEVDIDINKIIKEENDINLINKTGCNFENLNTSLSNI